MMTTAEERLAEAIEAERERLRALAGGEDWYFLRDDYFIPDGPPAAILPPKMEPPFTQDELLSLEGESYGREYYMRSGRYLGVSSSQEEAAKLDKYRFTRCFLPGGVLPWERRD